MDRPPRGPGRGGLRRRARPGRRPVCDVWETEVRAPRPHARVRAEMDGAGPVPDRASEGGDGARGGRDSPGSESVI